MHARGVAVGVTRRAAENLAHTTVRQVTDTLDAADGALRVLADLEERDGNGRAQRADLSATMRALVSAMPRIHNLIITDERGHFIVSYLPAARGRLISVDDRPYFRYHRSHADTGVHLSGPAISKTDKRWVLFATRRIDHRDGSFAGVVIAPIAMSDFLQSFGELDIGTSGAIGLLTSDGTLIVRRPGGLSGQHFHFAGITNAAFDKLSGVSYIGSSPVDGVRRLFAFEQTPRYPLVVEVGLAESEYLAAWHTDALANYSALAVGTGVFGILAAGLGAQISRRKRAEEALAISSTDTLTGLANKHRFESELEREWVRSAQHRKPVGLLLLEVVNLKAFNDRYGHQEGDDLLISIARTIVANVIPTRDVAARYDGLVFAVMLPESDASVNAIIAERIRAAIERLVLERAGTGTSLPVTIGTASLAATGSDESAKLVNTAFRALHNAKREGQAEATALAPVDALTGLANRRRFDAELESAWQRAAQTATPLGFLVIGIDNLKEYNERHGRHDGDELLISIGRTIANSVPATGLVTRYSGLSFAALLPGADGFTAQRIAQQLRVAIRRSIDQRSDSPNAIVNVSVGAAGGAPRPTDAPSTLVSTALIDMRTGKHERELAPSRPETQPPTP